MLVVRVPDNLHAERAYAAHVVFREFLGLAVEVSFEPRCTVSVEARGAADVSLAMDDSFFAAYHDTGMPPLPSLPLRTAPRDAAVDDALPILWGSSQAVHGTWSHHEHATHLHVDVLGTAFFFLTRLEEYTSDERDVHGRFPASASLARRAGLLERPIVDEHVEVLWECLAATWPQLERRPRSYQLVLTHDVDCLFACRGVPAARRIRDAASDVWYRQEWSSAARRLVTAANGDARGDPAYTFPFLMQAAERAGLRGTFNFLPGGIRPNVAPYSLAHPEVRRLAAEIADRGHDVGYHCSYDAGDDPGLVPVEATAVREAGRIAGAARGVTGGRYHYLRWNVRHSWRAFHTAGLSYDSSLGFPDAPGFRAGTCHDFPVFDLVTRRQLEVVERPLIAMEVSLFSRLYGALSAEGAMTLLHRLATRCRRHHGQFVLLWHNDSLIAPRARAFYETVCREFA